MTAITAGHVGAPDPRVVEDIIAIGERAALQALARSKQHGDERAAQAISDAGQWLRDRARELRGAR